MIHLPDTYQQIGHRKKVEGSQAMVQGKAPGEVTRAVRTIRPRPGHSKAKRVGFKREGAYS